MNARTQPIAIASDATPITDFNEGSAELWPTVLFCEEVLAVEGIGDDATVAVGLPSLLLPEAWASSWQIWPMRETVSDERQ